MNIIETHKLTKTYGKNRGIIDLNLNVEEGEFFGFIGPNGAGKSTTIRTLLGLIFPTSGSAKIFGKDIVRSKTEILSQVGYMPSEAAFYNGMRVKEVISFSAKIRKIDCTEESNNLCERLNLDTEKRVEELSLGNRKKMSIVCAMQHKPSLYILDEPTSGLDPLMQREFFDILQERHHNGATILFSSHVLSEIQKHCSRAAIIKEGRLIALDSVENLSSSGAKRVTLHGVNSTPQTLRVDSVESGSDYVSFLFNGNVNELLRSLIDLPIYDMTIAEPELEEIFMHYYQNGGEQK